MPDKTRFVVHVDYTNTAEKADYEESFVIEAEEADSAIFSAAKLFYGRPGMDVALVTSVKVLLAEEILNDDDEKAEDEDVGETGNNEGDTPGDPPPA